MALAVTLAVTLAVVAPTLIRQWLAWCGEDVQ